jgi:hypothetical protein
MKGSIDLSAIRSLLKINESAHRAGHPAEKNAAASNRDLTQRKDCACAAA